VPFIAEDVIVISFHSGEVINSKLLGQI